MAAVNHVGLCVADLDRATRFYEQVLGFEEVRRMDVPDAFTSSLLRVPPPVGLTAVYLQRDGFTLELLHLARTAPPRDRPFTEPGLTHISLTVDDLEHAKTATTEHGGEVLADTEVAGVAVMVRDPDGQVLELLTPGAMG
jgi:catechol 2,3-dioxygenase-like lactoylglutathione lyase family enzyme